jgi:hypothetical protein
MPSAQSNIRKISGIFFFCGLLFGLIVMWAWSHPLWWQPHPVGSNIVAALLIIPSPLVLSVWTGYFVARRMNWVGGNEVANGPLTGTAILACSFYLPCWAFIYIGGSVLLFLNRLSPQASRTLLTTNNWMLHDSPTLVALVFAALLAAAIVGIALRRITGKWDVQVFWFLLAASVATVPLGYFLGSLATKLSPDIVDKLAYFFPIGNSLISAGCGFWIARAGHTLSGRLRVSAQ